MRSLIGPAGSETTKPRGHSGPRRMRSVGSYLRQTRLLALLAVMVLAAGIVSDLTNGTFWTRYSLLADIAANVIVVLLTVAVINEIIERRRRQRWHILAQYVMFELVRNTRMYWIGVLETAGLLPSDTNQREFLHAGERIVRDTTQLSAAVRRLVGDTDARTCLHRDIAFFAMQLDEELGRWAAVMLNVELYAEIIDRHVELAGTIVWIGDHLDASEPPDDVNRRRRARSSPAVQIEYQPGIDWLADRIVITAQLTQALDKGTLELALQLVPLHWWEARLGTTAHPWPDTTESQGRHPGGYPDAKDGERVNDKG